MRNFEKVETWSFVLSPTIYVELNFYGALPTADDLCVLDQYLAIAERALAASNLTLSFSDKDASIPTETEAARDPFSHSPGQD